MDITKIRERISKTESDIEKMKKLIDKKEKKIAEFQNIIETSSDENAVRFARYDLRSEDREIQQKKRDMDKKIKLLVKYNEQLNTEKSKLDLLSNEIPDNLKKMQIELIEKWDEWDKERRSFLNERYSELGYMEFLKTFSNAQYEFRRFTDSEIHESNVKASEIMIIDLYNRIFHITGEITDWSYLNTSYDNSGNPILTGYVVGEKGRANVESILAGGYHIQKLHVRVLVKSF